MSRVLVTGATGALGRVVVRQALAQGCDVVGVSRRGGPVAGRVEAERVDVRDRDAVQRVLTGARPDLVVHTAYAQDDWATTADGSAHVALGARAAGARLVHVSSDVVFSGARVTYSERDLPDPVSPYGAAKAAAETAVAAIDPSAVIARTSLVMGSRDSPMERRVHALLDGTATGELFTDDIRCPVHVADLASALLELGRADASGVRHVAGPDAVSRFEIGELVAARDGLPPAGLRPGSRRASGVPGPLDVRLDCAWTQGQLRTVLRGARTFLSDPEALL
ncbi:MAG TPA: sugar nucleotide-binding protein [Pedococcus sp.]|uniref:SDR family oxidoreductase n=1 Tax=Pedococcus sp. TaxID=2860345 RepID=UPI002F943E49